MKPATALLTPYHLAAIDGDWQLLAYCHRRKKVLTFLPIRIRALSETGETFERPADFCIDDYLDSGFRKVRGKGAARITENYIRKTARLEGNKLCCQIEKLRQKKEFIRKMAMSLSQGARARFGKGATNDD